MGPEQVAFSFCFLKAGEDTAISLGHWEITLLEKLPPFSVFVLLLY